MIRFLPLTRHHLPLLYKWQNTPHVHKWWGNGYNWTKADIEHKYSSYIDKYKVINQEKKPIYPYVIQHKEHLIGYIQSYSIHDFHSETNYTKKLPNRTGSIDFYIGEKNYIGHGLSTIIIDNFLKIYFWNQFDFCYVTTNKNNIASVKCFKKLQFHTLPISDDHDIHMIRAHVLDNHDKQILDLLGNINNEGD
ncbi:MAG: acetyltransferase [Chitinophagaceae bacterium]|jgi:aminoglycoside 6'-N-acetyltransferase|nr:acetyltransferase [Chitinophagaceae bacterium]